MLSAPAAFLFFIAFMALRISLFEGGLTLISSSVGILAGSSLSIQEVEGSIEYLFQILSPSVDLSFYRCNRFTFFVSYQNYGWPYIFR